MNALLAAQVSTDCAGCVGMDDDLNQDSHEGIDGNHGTPLDAQTLEIQCEDDEICSIL